MLIDHASLIEALGGGQKVAKALNQLDLAGLPKLGRDAVYKWKQENRIPYRWRDGVRVLAAEAGLDLPADIRPPEPALQPAGKAAPA